MGIWFIVLPTSFNDFQCQSSQNAEIILDLIHAFKSKNNLAPEVYPGVEILKELKTEDDSIAMDRVRSGK